jgi:hypothetical protein
LGSKKSGISQHTELLSAVSWQLESKGEDGRNLGLLN